MLVYLNDMIFRVVKGNLTLNARLTIGIIELCL